MRISSQELIKDQFKVIGKFRKLVTKNCGNRDHRYIYYVKMQCVHCGEIFYRLSTNCRKFDCIGCKKIQTVQKYVGVKNHRYEILSFSHKKGTQYFYKVKCVKCGREDIKSYSGIFNKNRRIQGCVFCADKTRELNPDAPFHVYESSYKKGAKKRNLVYELTKEQFKNLVTQDCYYCGAKPKIYNSYKYTSVYMNGIDRIDNSIGYVIDNCVPCCKFCNQMKMEKSQYDFLNKIKEIYCNLINKGSETIEKTSEKDGTE